MSAWLGVVSQERVQRGIAGGFALSPGDFALIAQAMKARDTVLKRTLAHEAQA